MTTVTGPVEYIVVGFPGNQFKGEIAPALADLIDSGAIRIIDLVFVKKDADGTVSVFEYDGLEETARFAELDGEVGGLLTDDDVRLTAESLPPDTSAALLVWEDCWATPFVEALRNAGGVLLAGERIPRDVVEAALAELPAAS
jgi:hypothetical protein